MKEIKQLYRVKAPVEDVWQALVEPKIINKWGGGPAEMGDKKGTEFSLWGGDVHGTNTNVKPPKLLDQDWYSGKWDKPSKVTFRLKAAGDYTEIELTQTDVPEADFKDIDQGWKDYYLGPLSELFE